MVTTNVNHIVDTSFGVGGLVWIGAAWLTPPALMVALFVFKAERNLLESLENRSIQVRLLVIQCNGYLLSW